MAKSIPYLLTVVSNHKLSPNMRRITLSGPSLATFPPNQEGGYVKLVFPSTTNDKPRVRTYTIKSCDPASQQIVIDFVIHTDGGPASTWAENAATGTPLAIMGPGLRKPVSQTADWFLIAGDMTALPAIRVNLQSLPENAKGHLVLEIMSETDKSALDIAPDRLPPQLQVHWLINPHPGLQGMLSDYLAQLQWLEGSPAIWIACELTEVLKARTLIREKSAGNTASAYFSSYWQFGMTEDRHKIEKRRLLGS